jgi:hypothetical protein
MAGIAEQLQGQCILRGCPFTPEPDPQWDPHEPIRPHQEHQREAQHQPALLAGKDPCQALHHGRKGLGNDRIIKDEVSPFPDEKGANGALQECLPRPVSLQHAR